MQLSAGHRRRGRQVQVPESQSLEGAASPGAGVPGRRRRPHGAAGGTAPRGRSRSCPGCHGLGRRGSRRRPRHVGHAAEPVPRKAGSRAQRWPARRFRSPTRTAGKRSACAGGGGNSLSPGVACPVVFWEYVDEGGTGKTTRPRASDCDRDLGTHGPGLSAPRPRGEHRTDLPCSLSYTSKEKQWQASSSPPRMR